MTSRSYSNPMCGVLNGMNPNRVMGPGNPPNYNPGAGAYYPGFSAPQPLYNPYNTFPSTPAPVPTYSTNPYAQPNPAPYQAPAPYQNTYMNPYANQAPAPMPMGGPISQTQPSSRQNSFTPNFKAAIASIPPVDRPKYGNLYGLIAAIDNLEEEFCNGNISEEEHTRILGELLRQFQILQSALNFTKTDVERFCQNFNLSGGFAIAVAFKQNQPQQETSSAPARFGDIVLLGSLFTTLSDYTTVPVITASQYLENLNQIQKILTNVGIIPSDVEVAKMTTKWITKFQNLKPSECPDKSLTEELFGDIPIWDHMVKEH